MPCPTSTPVSEPVPISMPVQMQSAPALAVRAECGEHGVQSTNKLAAPHRSELSTAVICCALLCPAPCCSAPCCSDPCCSAPFCSLPFHALLCRALRARTPPPLSPIDRLIVRGTKHGGQGATVNFRSEGSIAWTAIYHRYLEIPPPVIRLAEPDMA